MRVREAEADEVAAERERERMAMLVIDWHDFTVVRTIEFDETEDETTLPPPLALKDVLQMNKAGVLPGALSCLYLAFSHFVFKF